MAARGGGDIFADGVVDRELAVFGEQEDVGGALDLGLDGLAIAENEERGAGIDEFQEENEHGK